MEYSFKLVTMNVFFHNYIILISLDNSRIHPITQLINVGEGTRITCISTSIVNFFFNRGNIPENARLQSQTLHLTRISEFNEGNYDCEGIDHNVIFNSQGNKRRFAARSIIRVKGHYLVTHFNTFEVHAAAYLYTFMS